MKARRIALAALLFSFSLNAQIDRRPVPEPRVPLPLDPLTAVETARAEEVARGNGAAKEFLAKGRSRLIYVQYIAVKRDPKITEPSGRFADVLFYRYPDDMGLRLLVDLEAGAAVDVANVRGRSVPLAAAEVEEAARLALAQGEVVRLLGENAGSFRAATGPATREQLNDNRIEALRTLGSTPDDPCTRERCVVLFFRSHNRYIAMNQVVVDLTTGRVTVNREGVRR
jgi:hypothetical protein